MFFLLHTSIFGREFFWFLMFSLSLKAILYSWCIALSMLTTALSSQIYCFVVCFLVPLCLSAFFYFFLRHGPIQSSPWVLCIVKKDLELIVLPFPPWYTAKLSFIWCQTILYQLRFIASPLLVLAQYVMSALFHLFSCASETHSRTLMSLSPVNLVRYPLKCWHPFTSSLFWIV